MDKAFVKKELKWRCKKHPEQLCDIINLNGDDQDRVMCFRCFTLNPIPESNMITMSCVLAAKDEDILETYPPLKDEILSNRLRNSNSQQYLEEIEHYFKNLLQDFEKEVQAALQKAKDLFIQQQKENQDLLDEYIRIAEIQKLKQLIVSDKEGAAKDLDSFIKEKWIKAEENNKVMRNLLVQLEIENCFSSEQTQKIAQEMIDRIKSIKFFEQRNSSNVNLIKSTLGSSQQFEINKIDQQNYIIKKRPKNSWGQVFIDPILDPLKRYIFHIELEQQQGNIDNHFCFGLLREEEKDSIYGFQQNMSYYDYSNSYGITKYIKGNPMQSASKITGKHSFEIRIDLNQKLLRVASLPDYSSVAELDDPNKIDSKVTYRFYLAMYSKSDIMRIKKLEVVSEFDSKM